MGVTRRDDDTFLKNGEKTVVSLDKIEQEIENLLQDVQSSLYEKALAMKEKYTRSATTFEEFNSMLNEEKPGFVKAMWCGEKECELDIKDKTGGVTSRCIAEQQEQLSDKCICCGKPSKHMVYWGRAY